jgi:hypothetical protein
MTHFPIRMGFQWGARVATSHKPRGTGGYAAFRVDGRQTLPWDYVRVARDPPAIGRKFHMEFLTSHKRTPGLRYESSQEPFGHTKDEFIGWYCAGPYSLRFCSYHTVAEGSSHKRRSRQTRSKHGGKTLFLCVHDRFRRWQSPNGASQPRDPQGCVGCTVLLDARRKTENIAATLWNSACAASLFTGTCGRAPGARAILTCRPERRYFLLIVFAGLPRD